MRRAWRDRSAVRRLALLATPAVAALLIGAGPAAAAPIWNLDIHHAPTNFAPGAGASATATTTTQGSGSVDELQRLLVRGLGGKFNLTFSANTTPDLAFDASRAQVESALEALPGIGAGNVSVTGGPGDLTGSTPYLITFTGALTHTDVAQLVAASSTAAVPNQLGTARLGGAPQYWFDVQNVGDAATTGTTTLTVNLPSGVTRVLTWNTSSATGPGGWSCPGSPGDSTVVCTMSASLRAHETDAHLNLAVNVDPGVCGANPSCEKFLNVSVSGGGAAAQANALERTRFSATPAPFGFLADSFTPGFFQPNGLTAITQSGAHPPLFTIPFDLTSVDAPAPSKNSADAKQAAEPLRHLTAELPPGFLGDPTALPECATPDFLDGANGGCPPSTQVGKIETSLEPSTSPLFQHIFTRIALPVYNLAHPKGAVADLGFILLGNPIHVKAVLDPARNYAIKSVVTDINESFPPFNAKLTLWGVPADPSHDHERCTAVGEVNTSQSCPVPGPRKAFLTTPFECGVAHQMTFRRYDSWEHPGDFGPDLTKNLAGGPLTGCDQNQALFAPTATATPTNTRADSPTGLNIEASVPQNTDPDGVATPPVKDLEITLPEGMALNPSFADGLTGCSEEQIGISHAGIPDSDKVSCPDQARIGSVDLSTPLLPEAPDPATDPRCSNGGAALQGSIYLAKQTDNPVNSLFAIYTVVHDCEDRGVLVKLPGALTLNPVTGQITTTFTDLPQFPFDHLSVAFRGGDRAPLVNPPTCGTKTSTGTLNTWSEPATDVSLTSSYEITNGADGGPCFADPASRPFSPLLDAGSIDPVASTYSPFTLKLTRQDGEQEPVALNVALPPGLTGKLAGVGQCSEDQIASIPAAPGTGAAELVNPTCPPSSRLGTVYAGSGAGPQPFFIQGSAYLAGPYDPDAEGPAPQAPLSLAIVTPAVAGGIDLGNVVLRSALNVNPRTAQISVDTAAVPTIVQGVPIHLREIRVKMDRPEFTITPSNCEPMAVTATTTGSSGAVATSSDRYQVGQCDSLNFAPDLHFTATGGKKATKKNQHPGLLAELDYPPSYFEGGARQSNIKSVEVTLPKQMLLDQSSPAFATICTRPQYAAGACPASTQVGTAIATTPLLDQPLTGPVYLKSSDNKLPDLAADLEGIIDIDLFGRVDQNQGRIRNTFDVVPDAPVSSFVLQVDGGPDGILVNANAGKGLCESKKRRRIDLVMNAQNGDRITKTTMLGAKCPKRKGHGHRGR